MICMSVWPEGGFEYAHNSYIVNLAKVEGLEKNVALLRLESS